MTDLAHTLPDVVRWRNRLIGDRVVATVPLDSLNRAVSSDRFYLHVNSPWNDVAVDGDGKVAVKTPSDTFHFDYVIAGTGYRVDLSAQPELASVHDTIAIWRDHFQPGPGEANAALGIYPYLGDGLRFLPREGTGADYVRNIHCFNLAASLCYGIPVGDACQHIASGPAVDRGDFTGPVRQQRRCDNQRTPACGNAAGSAGSGSLPGRHSLMGSERWLESAVDVVDSWHGEMARCGIDVTHHRPPAPLPL